MPPTGPDGGIRLDDPHLPVDPESTARAVGAAIRRAHDGPAGRGTIGLSRVAARLQDAAGADNAVLMDSGPYLGRPVAELARLAVETVSVLPPVVRPTVAVRPGFTLGDCVLHADGSIVVGGVRAAGDRELELAAAAIALGSRHGPAVVAPLLDAYGMDLLDLRRLDTSQLLVSIAAEIGVDLDSVIDDV
ncbi:MAG: hypothetical protein AAGC53_12040 [Actinomycetota bacterium]